MRLRNRINLELARRKVQETAFAKTVHMDQGHFNRIKNGRVQPTLVTALRIARALGKRVDQVFWIEEDPQ